MNREILRLALPSILANITVPLVGMVDIAVAGHLDGLESGAAAFIAAIALGSTLFDLLYWNFAFLRSGTGGLTAQAYGQGNLGECARVLKRALAIWQDEEQRKAVTQNGMRGDYSWDASAEEYLRIYQSV